MWACVVVTALCVSTVSAPPPNIPTPIDNQAAGQECRLGASGPIENIQVKTCASDLYCGDANSKRPTQTGVCIKIPDFTDCVEFDLLIKASCDALSCNNNDHAKKYCPAKCQYKRLCTAVAPNTNVDPTTTDAPSTTGGTADETTTAVSGPTNGGITPQGPTTNGACLMWIMVTWIGNKFFFD